MMILISGITGSSYNAANSREFDITGASVTELFDLFDVDGSGGIESDELAYMFWAFFGIEWTQAWAISQGIFGLDNLPNNPASLNSTQLGSLLSAMEDADGDGDGDGDDNEITTSTIERFYKNSSFDQTGGNSYKGLKFENGAFVYTAPSQ